MKVQYVRPRTLCLRGLALALALGGFQVAHAATISDSAFDSFMRTTVGAGQETVGFSSTGTPVAVTGTSGTLTTDGTNKPVFTRSGTLTNPSGNKYTVTAAAKVAPTTFAALIKKALPLVPVLGTGVALYDFARELGFTPSSTGTITKDQTQVNCSTKASLGNACGYWTDGRGGQFTSPQQACDARILYDGGGWASYFVSLVEETPSRYVCNARSIYGSNLRWWMEFVQTGAGTQTTIQEPKTLDDLASEIAAKSGWPSTSKLADAVAQAQTLTGDKIATETPTITGPATSTGTTTTTTNPDGTTKTQTINYGHTYQGDTITTTTTTNISNYNPVTNTTTTTTETATPAPTPEPTKTDCDKIPDAVGCSKYGIPDSPSVTKNTTGISITPFTLASGAGCPAPLPVSAFGHSYELSYTPACTAASYLRFLILAMAAVMAGYVFVEGLKS